MELAFVGKAGINKSVYDAYINVQTPENAEPGCMQVADSSLPCDRHYRNNVILDNWDGSDIETVAYVFYKDGNIVASTTFDGRNSTITNWFSKARIVSSSFTDLDSSTPTHTADGMVCWGNRRFSLFAGGVDCNTAAGWMITSDILIAHCAWETRSDFPNFLYSTTSTAGNFLNAGEADTMAIWVK